MAKGKPGAVLDRELSDLPPELRWRTWMGRIEAVLFASAAPASREDLARVVGQGASVDLLVGDLAADLEGRSFEGWCVDAPYSRDGQTHRSKHRSELRC